jgi:hypothetical protein
VGHRNIFPVLNEIRLEVDIFPNGSYGFDIDNIPVQRFPIYLRLRKAENNPYSYPEQPVPLKTLTSQKKLIKQESNSNTVKLLSRKFIRQELAYIYIQREII